MSKQQIIELIKNKIKQQKEWLKNADANYLNSPTIDNSNEFIRCDQALNTLELLLNEINEKELRK